MYPKQITRKTIVAGKISQSANPRNSSVNKPLLNTALKRRNNLEIPLSDDNSNMKMSKMISSTYSVGDYGALEELPSLESVNDTLYPDFFCRKCNQCRVKCNFNNPMLDRKNIQLKTQHLTEITNQLSKPSFYKILNSEMIREMFKMVKSNVFRTFPPIPILVTVPLLGDELAYNIFESSWPHLELIYNIIIKFLENPLCDISLLQTIINEKDINRFFSNLNSPDQRERNCLKQLIHRFYLRFVHFRPYIRQVINHHFYTFISEKTFFFGINELLETMIPIINGYSVPFKEEYLQFYHCILLPLHSSDYLYSFHENLTTCVTIYLQKSMALCRDYLKALLIQWPVSSTIKELLFVGFIEQLFDYITDDIFVEIMKPLTKHMCFLIISNNFRVSESAMLLWKNDRFVELISSNHQVLFPYICPALYKTGMNHWSSVIKNIAVSVIRICMDSMPPEEAASFNKQVKNNEVKSMKKLQTKKQIWLYIEKLAFEQDNNQTL